MSTIRINSTNDIIIILLKLFIVLQNLLITNEYCSLIILLLISITDCLEVDDLIYLIFI